MLDTVTYLLGHHMPAPRAGVSGDAAVAALVADDDVRHEWSALLAAATSPADRDEINDVFGRAVR